MNAIDQAYKNLLPDLEKLEAYRLKKKRIIRNNKQFLLFLLILGISGIAYVLLTDRYVGEDAGFVITMIVFFLLIELIVAGIIYAVNKGKYQEFFKENIIEKLVPALIPGISYKHDQHISFDSFRECNLFSKSKANKIDGSDYFYGKSGMVTFELSWLKVYSEVLIRKTGHVDINERKYHRSRGADIFNGIFMIAGLNQTVSDAVYIVPSFKEYGKLIKAASSSLNIIGQSDLPEVEMDESDFKERYVVHCENDTTARNIVTSAIMKEMVRIKKENDAFQIYASFVNNKVYVAIDGAKDIFEPKIDSSLLDTDSAQNIFKNLLTYLNILKVFVIKRESEVT